MYAAFAPHIEARLDPVTGDEPFYLMTVHNILAGRGLNEAGSWANRDYLAEFYPRLPLPADWQGWDAYPKVLPPHNSMGTIPPGLYSKHGLGLALLILPFYAAGKRTFIVLFLAGLGALLAANIFLLAYEASAKRWVGLAVWPAFSFTNPLMSYSYLIFPEIPAALFTLYAFRRIRQPANNGWQTAGIALSIATLPWLHARFAPIAAALGAYWLWKHFWLAPRLSSASIPPLLLPSLSAAALLDFYYYFYRSFLPNAQDHGGTSNLLGTLNGLAGLFLDQQWGLLVAAPVYLLALAAIIAVALRWCLHAGFRARHSSAAWYLLVTVPYFLLIANYRLWWGEWCPPARYPVAILPLLALPLAIMAARAPVLSLSLGIPLALASWAVMGCFLSDPQLMYNQPTGQAELFGWLADRTALDLTTLVPSFVVPSSSAAGLATRWIAGAGLLTAGIGLILTWGSNVTTASRVVALPDAA
ncbi:MAG TPA: hypothetical protein VKU60_11310 [Chloroflexota bacterium]|nr:hypothetical protein [Chloroflexota bacterium]